MIGFDWMRWIREIRKRTERREIVSTSLEHITRRASQRRNSLLPIEKQARPPLTSINPLPKETYTGLPLYVFALVLVKFQFA